MAQVKGVVGSEVILVDGKLSGGKFSKTCCKEYLKIQPSLYDGVYLIKPFDDEPEFKVFCDMKNGGYIQLNQRRISGEVDFYRKWTDFADGFGDPKTNYWLGLNRISKFTQLNPHSTFRIDLFHNTLKQNFNAQYANFLIESENRNFTMELWVIHFHLMT